MVKLVLLILCTFSQAQAFTALNATEATMVFQHWIEVSSSNRSSATRMIERQLKHLTGPMQSSRILAAPKNDHQIKNLSMSRRNGKWIAEYTYQGTILVDKMNDGTYRIALPRHPDSIFEVSKERTAHLPYNPCANPAHNELIYFWYYWNPSKPSCPLVEGQDYDWIDAKIFRKPSMVESYPEYNRLVDPAKRIIVTIVYGMDDEDQAVSPYEGMDANKGNFLSTAKDLIDLGFKKDTWNEAKIRQYIGTSPQRVPFVQEFTKDTPKGLLSVRLYHGPTRKNSGKSFHYFLRNVVRWSSVIIYNGHSGFGAYLDMDQIEDRYGIKFNFNPGYQIIYFNGCSGYSYYPSAYRSRKSSKNLDILSTGRSLYFSQMNDGTWAMLQAIHDWSMNHEIMSYQEIIKYSERTAPKDLVSVSGDEDNPTDPRAVE